MLFHRNRKLTKCHLIILYLLLTQCCKGESQLINSPQTIIATLGHDIILPCHLVPGEDASDLTLEWTRPDLNPRFVHVYRFGEELVDITHKLFKKRTSLFTDELKLGNISLKLSKVKIHDEGTFRCFIPEKQKQSFVQLVVGSDAVTSPVITLADTNKANGLVLRCESEGWYPEPEVFWLDREENLISAGPTETVRGPDDLYTVSSRLTVRKSDSFTCRVQQKNINQTRETHFYVPDDFFELQSSSSAVTAVLAVSLAVCITFIFSVIFLLWKWRQKIIKIKTSRRDETDQGGTKKRSKTGAEGDEEQAQPLKKHGNVEVNKHVSWNPYKWFKDEQQERLKQLETKQTELQQLREEKERNENEQQQQQNQLQTLNDDLESKNTEVKTLTEEKKTLNNELEDTRRELETKQTGLQQLRGEKETNENELKKEVKKKNKEVEKFTEEKKKLNKEMRNMLQTLDDLEKKNKEFENELSEVRQELQKEKEERAEAEEELKAKIKEIEKLKEEKKTKEDKLQNELQTLKDDLKKKNTELTEEKKKHVKEMRNVLQTHKDDLEKKNKEFENELSKVEQEKKKEKEERTKAEEDLKAKIKEIASLSFQLETKQTELQQLRGEKQRNENELKDKLEKKNTEFENKLSEVQQELQKEKAKIKEVEKLRKEEKKTLNKELEDTRRELQDIKTKSSPSGAPGEAEDDGSRERNGESKESAEGQDEGGQ